MNRFLQLLGRFVQFSYACWDHDRVELEALGLHAEWTGSRAGSRLASGSVAAVIERLYSNP